MKADELRKKYLEFFKSKGHKVIKSASLIPENDPTVLFTTAGMHPLVPFLLGQKHPLGKRIVNVQKCIRTGDIDSVGDDVHLTFFEMLGNWSLGDYFKKEAISWSFEFLTKILKIPKEKLAVTVFAGDKDAPKDEESAKIWISLGIPKERIAFLPKEDNWWGPAGATGPCGPCTEMFYYLGEKIPKIFDLKNPKWVEIWNDVLMEYNKTKDGKYELLKQKNVDTGMGLERTSAILQGKSSVYDIELFIPIIKEIEKISKKNYKGNERSMRIITDHLKAATFILGDDKHITPGNVEQGYVVRRLIRRAVRYGKELGIKGNFTKRISKEVIELYKETYPGLNKNKEFIFNELNEEENKFNKVLTEGLKAAEKIFSSKISIKKEKFLSLMRLAEKKEIFKDVYKHKRTGKPYSIKELGISEKEMDSATISGKEAFLLYQSIGFPIEMITELVREKNLFVDIEAFNEEYKKHQELSRTASSGMFKSGLADNSEITTKLHTATHLLNEALRRIISKTIEQRGSNITPERTRFDFNFDRKLTQEEIKKVEDEVNKVIKEGLKVERLEMSPDEAKKLGAQALFTEKYGGKVSVYKIGNYSTEVCTGPHVSNTKEIGHFKIIKEESSSAGVRRIKAVIE